MYLILLFVPSPFAFSCLSSPCTIIHYIKLRRIGPHQRPHMMTMRTHASEHTCTGAHGKAYVCPDELKDTLTSPSCIRVPSSCAFMHECIHAPLQSLRKPNNIRFPLIKHSLAVNNTQTEIAQSNLGALQGVHNT